MPLRVSTSLLAVTTLVLGTLAVATVPASASPPPQPGNFATSFEAGDPQPHASTVEIGPDGRPMQGNLSGSSPSGLPGSLLAQVTAVTASADNPPNEVEANLKDGNPSTKWLAFHPTGWVVYQLAQPAVVVKYSLTSANDSPGRDPRDWTLQGSDDGSTWTDLDTRTGQSFSNRFVTNVYSFANTTAYGYYRLNITRNAGDGLVQLADWDISDGSNVVPPATPMVTEVGTGPVSGYNMKPQAGFTGLASLRYSGGAQADGRSYATNNLYDVNIPVGPKTRLSYKIFPEFTARDTQYPAQYAAIDLHFTDGTYLSQLAPIDQHGYPLTAAGQGASKVLYADQWNDEESDVGAVAAGKTIDRILLAYDNPGATAKTRFQGWIDDLTIDADPPAIDASSYSNYVDTRRGTNASGSFSRGNNLPITAVPNGFNFLTPVTDANSQSWEYTYQAANNAQNLPTLQGLGISHEPSPWMGDRDNFSIMPVPQGGSLTGNPAGRAQPFSHTDEVAHPDYYRVTMQDGMVAEMTPTDHGAAMRFTFPAAGGSLVFYNGTFTLSADGTVTGWVDNGSGLSAGRSRMFVSGTFDQQPTAVTSSAATFAAKQVTLRLATSLISTDQAAHNLDLEVAGHSFDELHAAATAAWNDRLGRVQVQGATQSQLVTLYSNLYRLNLYPNSQSENTGTAADPHWQYASPVSAHVAQPTATRTGAKIVDGQIYVNNGFWDTYRTVWPAYSLLYPDVAAKIADGFVQQYRDGGWIARWSSPGYADLMTGTSADAAMAEAYLNGVQLPDAMDAYEAAVKDATVYSGQSAVGRKGIQQSIFLGYTPNSVSESVSWALEGYINDYAIGNMAAALAKDKATPKDKRHQLREESTYFLQRARDYVNLFDQKTKFFEARDTAGNFQVTNPLDWGSPYTETDGWNFAFTAQQDPQGLINLYGGQQALEAKLDQFFATPENADHPGAYGGVIHEMREAQAVRMGQLGMSNQPSHHIPYLYDIAGDPAKTQAIVREILQRLYVGSEIGQGYPGDEDNGEMSSWYILSSLGIYPLQAGSPNWVIGSPQFTEMTVHRPTGDIVVTAHNNSPTNVYVQSVRVNGRPQHSVAIDSSVFKHGGRIDFVMGAQPSAWGSGKHDLPPSLTHGSQPPQPLQDVTGPGLGTATGPDGQDASALFDDTSATQLTVDGGTATITWKGRARQRPTYYTITSGANAGDPADWVLEGSNDGIRWATLDRRHGETFAWRDQTRPFEIDKPGKFSQFRLVVTRTSGAAQLNLAEIELLAGGDVTVGGGPITVTPSADAHATTAGPVGGTLATVTGGTASGYQATIDWGDGTAPTAGTLTLSSRAVYAISGAHTYAKPGYYQAQVTVTDGSSQGTATVGIDVAYAPEHSLGAAFDTVCIGDDGVLAANCDAKNWAYSREALQAAGVVQGTEHDVPGTNLHFTLPVVPAGRPDDASGAGQTIALDLPADATAISFIGAGTEGNQDTTGTVTFTDGTTATIPIRFSDWTLGGNPNGTPLYGNIVVAHAAYRLHGTDKDPAQPFLFATTPYTIPAGKRIASVTLPKQTGDPGSAGRIHVFAIASDGTAPAPLTLTAPKAQTATAGQALAADLGTVTGGVPGSSGYQARVQWGDGTVPDDATVAAGAISGSHTYAEPGTYTVHVTAWDTAGSSEATFTVTVSATGGHAALTVDPQPAAPGGTITVTGTGFAPGEPVTIRLGDHPVAQATAAHDGRVQARIAVPRDTRAGVYPLTASGAHSRTPATVTVTVATPVPAVRYQPQLVVSAAAGRLTVSGDGFAANEAVTIAVQGGATTTARADAHGVLDAVTLPAGGAAKARVTATGARSHASTTATAAR